MATQTEFMFYKSILKPKLELLYFFVAFSKGTQVRGFAPIGMLEFWNIGIMGSGIMEWWV